mgnify:CR=1 FL=1
MTFGFAILAVVIMLVVAGRLVSNSPFQNKPKR